jgi:chromosomal replication initiation ATPase DnaA
MKKDIFKKYVQEVARVFELPELDLFTKSKERDKVDARHLLYYLCKRRPMRITYIQSFMESKGYNINHSSIIHGINQVEEKIEDDRDYMNIINKIESKCIV